MSTGRHPILSHTTSGGCLGWRAHGKFIDNHYRAMRELLGFTAQTITPWGVGHAFAGVPCRPGCGNERARLRDILFKQDGIGL